MEEKTIFIAAGGTLGHVMPALSLYKLAESKGFKPYFFCDERTQKFVKENCKNHFVYPFGNSNTGFKGRVILAKNIFFHYLRSLYKIRDHKPVACFGFGGYTSFPLLIASSHKRITTILHEQNAILGVANTLIAGAAISRQSGLKRLSTQVILFAIVLSKSATPPTLLLTVK
jgi:UDP-N-acetylglucosamine--N-acetylmuramyl-(pentapeptide) pyrophosphoryl-undecaprenol N-acetylglucosamine transferase